MKMEDLLTKLEALNLDYDHSFNSQTDAIEWTTKVIPLLQLLPNQTYYINFNMRAHEFTIQLSADRQSSNFHFMLNQIKTAIEEIKLNIEHKNKPKGKHIPQGGFLDIQKAVSSLVQTANNKLWFCDAYMDHLIIEEINSIPAKEIFLLTSDKIKAQQKFNTRLDAAKKQFKDKNIEVKIYNKIHDRYFYIDEKNVWILGTSFNISAGGKPTSLNQITVDVDKYIQDFKKQWQAASSYP